MKRSVRGYEDMTHAGSIRYLIVHGVTRITDIRLLMQKS
jgi:hypothetical protein